MKKYVKAATAVAIQAIMAFVIGFLIIAGINALPFGEVAISRTVGGAILTSLYLLGVAYEWATSEGEDE